MRETATAGGAGGVVQPHGARGDGRRETAAGRWDDTINISPEHLYAYVHTCISRAKLYYIHITCNFEFWGTITQPCLDKYHRNMIYMDVIW